MTLEPEKLHHFLENIWFVVASTASALTEKDAEDPMIRLTLARSEAPTIFHGILKFKKNGYYKEETFSLESPEPDKLKFKLYRRRLFLPIPETIKVTLSKQSGLACWEEGAVLPRQSVWHLLSLTPHPALDSLQNFIAETREGLSVPWASFRTCTQRSERLDLSALKY
jgi:hypothetical protein